MSLGEGGGAEQLALWCPFFSSLFFQGRKFPTTQHRAQLRYSSFDKLSYWLHLLENLFVPVDFLKAAGTQKKKGKLLGPGATFRCFRENV